MIPPVPSFLQPKEEASQAYTLQNLGAKLKVKKMNNKTKLITCNISLNCGLIPLWPIQFVNVVLMRIGWPWNPVKKSEYI